MARAGLLREYGASSDKPSSVFNDRLIWLIDDAVSGPKLEPPGDVR